MKIQTLIAGLAVSICLSQVQAACPQSCDHKIAHDELLYIGTQVDASTSSIFLMHFDEETGKFSQPRGVANIDRPTWVIAYPALSVLFAVSEIGNDGKSEASVFSLSVDSGTGALKIINHIGSGGGGATHLALDSASKMLFVANYGDGKVSALSVKPDGSLASLTSVQQDDGSGPSPRQKGPHAHGVTVDPSRRFLLVPDLGADRVFIYRFEAKDRKLRLASSVNLPPGSGPRRLVFSPSGQFAYLLTELSAEIRTYRWDATEGRLQLEQTLPASSPKYTGKKSAGEIASSSDGRFIYVSDRAEGTIIVYAVDQHTGTLSEMQRASSEGKQPWSFTISPGRRWMIVADKASDSVVAIKIDPETGLLTSGSQSVSIPEPTSATFYRR